MTGNATRRARGMAWAVAAALSGALGFGVSVDRWVSGSESAVWTVAVWALVLVSLVCNLVAVSLLIAYRRDRKTW